MLKNGCRGCVVSLTFLCITSLVPDAPAQEWNEWGGPNGDFVVPDASPLADEWPEYGPKILWRRKLGEGYSTILHKEGRLFTMMLDGKDEVVVGINAEDGKTVWEHRVKAEMYKDQTDDYGRGPNATPLIIGDRIVAIGNSGKMRCLDVNDGTLIWQVDLHDKYGRHRRIEEYGYSTSPLEYQGNIIALVGGEVHGVVAINPEDGSLVWGSESCPISYAPPTIVRLANRNQLVFFSPTEVVGCDPSNGKFLWKYPCKCFTENNLTPAMALNEDHVWVATQLDGGTRVLAIESNDGEGELEFKARLVWEDLRLKQEHWNSFLIGDYIYGSIGTGSQFAAINWKTGKIAWRQRGFRCVKGTFADNKLFFVDENGQVGMAKLDPDGFEVLGSEQLLERVAWTAPTIVGTTMYVRDRKHILAIDLGSNPDR